MREFTKISFLVLITNLTFIGLSHQISSDKKCKDVKVQDVDVAWADEVTETKGWDVAMAAKIDPQMSAPPPPPEDKLLKGRRCLTVMVTTQFGTAPVPYDCRYDKYPTNQSCVLRTKGTPVENHIKFYGILILTKTDNRTYSVVYGCLSRADNHHWQVFVPAGTTLGGATKKEILAHVRTMGFSTEPKDMKSDSDEVAFTGLRKGTCDGRPLIMENFQDMAPRPDKKFTKHKPKESEDNDSESEGQGRGMVEDFARGFG